jgi:hypothetical protein
MPPCPGWSNDGTTTGQPLVDRATENQLFLDAQLAVFPHRSVTLFGGATFTTRHQVTYQTGNAMMFTAPPTVAAEQFTSFMAYAVAEWRPVQRLRLAYAFDHNRVRIIVPVQPLDNTVKAAGGSFQDHMARAAVRIWRTFGAEVRYRLRLRENTDIVHRFEGGLRGDLFRGLGGFVNVGGDVYQVSRVPAERSPQSSVVYTGGLSFTRPYLDVRAGVLYTQAIGAGVGFSKHATRALDPADPTSELFPLLLEAQRIGFVRAFGMWRWLFGGVDLELAWDARQVRAFVQLGGAL